jgi:hypothetical protein
MVDDVLRLKAQKSFFPMFFGLDAKASRKK